MIDYGEVARFINSLWPELRRTRRVNLSLLTYSILCRRCLCLSELARAMPVPTAHIYRVKRLWRFLSNGALCPLNLLWRVRTYLPSSRGYLRPLILDYTALGPFRVLVAASGYRGRALPLAVIPFLWEKLESSLNQLEEGLLSHLCPPPSWVIVADRGFGRASLFRFLKERGFPFVIRIAGEGMVEWRGHQLRVKDIPLKRGQERFLRGVVYHKGQRVRVNLALAWQGEEPWYLATSLSAASIAIRLYSRRMWIEEMFRDYKWRLGARGVMVREQGRLERLLLGLALAYWILALTGIALRHPRWHRAILTRGKASFTWLALQWLLQPHPPPPLPHMERRWQTG